LLQGDIMGLSPRAILAALAIIAALNCAPALATPGSYFVSGFGTYSSRDSGEAFMVAHERAVASAERSCSMYANSYNGEDWRVVEVRTISSNGTWGGDYFFANVNVSAKCIVTNS
jgi:hypothetical protein